MSLQRQNNNEEIISFWRTVQFHFLASLGMQPSINSSSPSTAYTRQWIRPALVQVDAEQATSRYLNQDWLIVNKTLKSKLQWKSNQNTKRFFRENAFENVVWEMSAILARGGGWVKK